MASSRRNEWVSTIATNAGDVYPTQSVLASEMILGKCCRLVSLRKLKQWFSVPPQPANLMSVSASRFILPFLIASCAAIVTPAHAAIVGIIGSDSVVNALFDDTNSLNATSNPGTTNLVTTALAGWSGGIYNQPLVVDPVTGDDATFGIFAFSTPTTYGVFLTGTQLTQQVGNSGFARMDINYRISFQMDAAGLPTQLISIPSINLAGTVQPLGFAVFTGSLTFESAALGTFNTVNYAYSNTTAGAFSTTITGTPMSPPSFSLPANDILTLAGTYTMIVDPASFSVEFVPEPSVAASAMLGLAACTLRRRRNVR